MADLYKYGVAVHLYKPLIKRSVVDFAVSADYTPVAGDVKISKDGGAAANVTNLPVAITMGNGAMWDFSLTATELQAKQVRITVVDAATKAIEDTMFEIDTYGNASAQHAIDLNTALPSNFATLSIDANGRVKVQTGLVRNVAVTAFEFLVTDSTNHQPKTGLVNASFTKQFSLDGGAFSGLSGTITEIASGYYKVDLAAGETNGAVVSYRFAAAGADDVDLTFLTTP